MLQITLCKSKVLSLALGLFNNSVNFDHITKHLVLFKYAGEDFQYRFLYFLNSIWQGETHQKAGKRPYIRKEILRNVKITEGSAY